MEENCRKDIRSIQQDFDFVDDLMIYYKGYNERTNLWVRLNKAVKERRLFKAVIYFVKFDIFVPYVKYYLIKFNYALSGRIFTIGGEKYYYLLKRYKSVDNERVIEVPYFY
jgi:hypothetical protein